MARTRRPVRMAAAMLALSLAFGLSACETFDLTDLIPDGKKKLPGERKEVFPGGVPGVPQGIPPELVKGNTPPEDPNAAAIEQVRQAEEKRAAEQKAAEESAKPKPKPKPKRAAAPKPVQQPQEEAQQQPAQQGGAWPNQQQARPAGSIWPSSNAQQQAGQSAWPAPPQSGTFSR